ncbi:S46 family peptidase [Aggregicoccus sp. 17bor-14]|nr:S46 family peptidase [Aggregicoccus sp. 17bor-14]
MWTYNNFPSQQVKQKYGFEPTQQWLDNVRLSSARLAGGCSASFVSENGLVMTNHHCARGCVEQLSTAKQNYLDNGFYAKTEGEERQCPAMELNRLEKITDVTDRMDKATQGQSGAAYATALKAEMAKIEKECATSDDVRCDVVTLYQGGRYNLYQYRRFQDVRLVFAPEHAIAFFGGDPDNFEFPRYDLDVSFLRVYQNGKPAKIDHYFKWSKAGAKDGELTFVSGHPGSTSRNLTVAQLAYTRDVLLPKGMERLGEMRGMLTEYMKRGPEQKRTASNLLFGTENSLKVYIGRQEALTDSDFFAKKVKEENDLRAKINADPKLKEQFGGAWDQIAQAVKQAKNMRVEVSQIAMLQGLNEPLFQNALRLVRYADELAKPNEQRLREYVDSNVPALKAQIGSAAPLYPELEIARLTHSLTKMREDLGPNHPFVKKVLGNESPAALATRLVKGTRMFDPKVRLALLKGGKAAVDASHDSMIELAKRLDADSRQVRKAYEEGPEATLDKASELIGKAKFAAYGTGIYPDATFTLRLSYGSVKGYQENGKRVQPFTYMGGTYDHATGEDPFKLPPSWLRARGKINAQTPMNFVTTNDIIGGNSGSPMVNKDAEIVGLIFDGNIQSLGGDYGYDESVNRAVAVHSDALIEALDKVYGAKRVLEELRPGSTPQAPVKAPTPG